MKVDRFLLQRKDLGSTAKLVYAEINDRVGRNGKAWPGVRRLAADVGCSVNAILRAIAELERAGLVVVDRGDSGEVNTYRPNLITHPPKSAAETEALPKRKRSAAETEAQALPKRRQNQTKNQTKNQTNTGKPRKRDPIWDAVCELFALTPTSKTDRSRVGKVVRDLKTKDATADEIRVRLERYRRQWPKVAATPEALLKHWNMFALDEPARTDPHRIRTGSSKYDGIAQRT